MIAFMVVIGLGMVSITFIGFTAQNHECDLPRDLTLGLDTGPVGLFVLNDEGAPTFLNETLVTWLGHDYDGHQAAPSGPACDRARPEKMRILHPAPWEYGAPTVRWRNSMSCCIP